MNPGHLVHPPLRPGARPGRPGGLPQRRARLGRGLPTQLGALGQAAAAGGVPGTDPNAYDYSSDPILQQVRARAAQYTAQAQAAADAARSQAMINFGYDPGLQSQYGDQNTAEAARQNPYSTLAELARAHEQSARNTTNVRNAQNLFYSSTYGQDIQNEGVNYVRQQYDAQQALQRALAGITGELTGAQSEAQGQITDAEQAAYERALQFGLRYGTGGAEAAGAPGAGPRRHAGSRHPAAGAGQHVPAGLAAILAARARRARAGSPV